MHQSNQKKTQLFIFIMIICYFMIVFSLWRFFCLIKAMKGVAIGYIFVVVFCLWLLYYVKGQYQKLKYGIKGEKEIYKYLSKQFKSAIVLKNVHVQVNRQELEIDTLVIDQKGVCIVEVKNYRGKLYGNENDEYWIQEKVLKDGKIEKKKVKNSIQQLERQKRLLSSYLKQNQLSCDIDGCVYVQIDQNRIHSRYMMKTKEQLRQYILQRNGKDISRSMMKKMKKLLS